MGLLAEFFIADHETAAGLGDTQSLPTSDVAQYKSFTELELGYLDQILNGREISYEEDSPIEPISIVDDGERVTSSFPEVLIDRLASLTDPDIERVASVWGECDELSCSGNELEPVIRDLRRLALTAKERNIGLYLWNCL